METLVFWIFPLLAVLIGLNGRLMAGWRCFVSAAAALYLGLWITPLWYGLLDFLPSEVEPYRIGAALLVTSGAVFALFFSAAHAITGDDDAFVFPDVMEKIVNALCRAGFGIALAALLFTVCCTTPLRTFTRNNGDGFERWAASAVLKVSAVGDALTFCTPKEPRAEALEKMWYKPPEPPRTEGENPPASVAAPEAAEPSSASASPAENQAQRIVSRGLRKAAPPAEAGENTRSDSSDQSPRTSSETAAAPKPPPASFAGGKVRRKPRPPRHTAPPAEAAPPEPAAAP